MNLDDRMRSAHKRQLDDITNQTRGRTFTPRPTPVLQRTAPALGLAVVAIVAFFGLRTLLDDGATRIESVDNPELPSVVTTTQPPDADVAATPADESTTTTTTLMPSSTTTTPDETATPEEPAPQEETAPPEEPVLPETTTSTTATSTTTASTTSAPPATTTTIATEVGLASVKCPSGRRAPLELAALRYVGPNTGWSRLDDLVDEQDDEFTFEAWEPGYPDEVTVEVTLSLPVDAVDIRVAQDPFTPVSGDIEITTFFDGAAIDTFAIPLSGVDGWVANTFAATTRIDQFTITRDGELENIMEVLVCVQ